MVAAMPRIGVLALQGDFEAHARMLEGLGVLPLEVRRAAALEELDGLVLPGGESTTLLNLMRDEAWFPGLEAFHARGGAMLATCAGAILLAREVRDPVQPSLGLLDAVVRRNGWGRQVDSFETRLAVVGWPEPLDAVFIRAPRFVDLGPAVAVLARVGPEPVLVRQDRILAGTFHPELSGDDRLHGAFLDLAARRAAPAGRRRDGQQARPRSIGRSAAP